MNLITNEPLPPLVSGPTTKIGLTGLSKPRSARGGVAKIGQVDTAPFFSAMTRQVTGSALGDAAMGGLVGYALSRGQGKLAPTLVGAVATGLAGVTGQLVTIGYLAWTNK